MADECKWGNDDCKNFNSKCHLCTAKNYHYESVIKKKIPMAKAKVTKRQGSLFEARNHVNNHELVNSRMTPNSGAGTVKGDEEISGIINIMEELKTHEKKNDGRLPGTESFTIQKQWLIKLNREAKEAKKEFWYLKFAFKNQDFDYYVITESSIIMDMVKTMIEDRKIAKLADNKIDVCEKRTRLAEAESAKLFAENEYLKARIKQLEDILKED